MHRSVLTGWVRFLLVLVLVVGVVQAVQVVVAYRGSPARADVSTGTAGVFVASQGRVLSTVDGTGGYSAPFAAGAWNPVQVDGLVGVPSSGVSAVQVTVTVVSPATGGTVSLSPDLVAPAGGTALVYGTGVAGSVSNTAIVAVGSDGKIKIRASTSINALIDVQGYYTGGADTAAGGFAPVPQVRFANTLNGTDVPLARVAAGSTINVPLGGLAGSGVPVDANAAFVNVQVINYGTNAGYITPFPHGSAKPASDGESFPVGASSGVSSSIGTTVPLGPDGSFDLFVGGTSVSVDLLIDVQGYFDGTVSGGGFTPAGARVLDTRISPNTAIAANATTSYQVTGIRGVPVMGSGISALSANIQVINTNSASGGYLRAWASDQAEPTGTANVAYAPSSIRSNSLAVQVGNDGKIKVHNVAGFAVDLVIDVQGWYSNVTTPISSGQSRTQQSVTLQAGSSGGPWVTYKYRVGTTATFSAVPSTDVSGNPTWPVTRSGSPAAFAAYTWNVAATLATAAGVTNPPDTLVQVVACYGSSNTDPSPVCSVPSSVVLTSHSFDDASATTSIGPGELSLLTGDLQVSDADAIAADGFGGLSLGRSLTTLAPIDAGVDPSSQRTNPSGVFGPGWTAALSGPSVGDAGMIIADSPAAGYVTFTSPDGAASVYQATTTVGAVTNFVGVGTSASDGHTVTKTSSTTITMADPDGTVTTWTGSGYAWQVSGVQQAGSSTTSTFTYNGSGLVTRLLAPTPDGVNCSTTPDTTPGCRSLTLVYEPLTIGTTTVTRLQKVNLSLPQAPGSANLIAVANYDYTSAGLLADAYDPRITPNLLTSYTYDASGRLSKLVPPGEVGWSFNYDARGRISSVTWPDPSGSTATSTVVYGVPISGSGAPVPLDGNTTATWNEVNDLPVVGTAIFPPTHVPAGVTPSTVISADWPYAVLHYMDVNGQEVNTAAYGAGAWQIDTMQFDSNGNEVLGLPAGNRAQALAPDSNTDSYVSGLISSADRAVLLASVVVTDPLDPSEVLETYGPTHPITLRSGVVIHARQHAVNIYDELAPNNDVDPITGAAYDQITTAISDPYDVVAKSDASYPDAQTIHYGYGAVNSGDPSGWTLYSPTTTTVQMGSSASSADIVDTRRLDSLGRTIETRLPGGAVGGTAQSTLTTYYAATGSGPCISAVSAGLVCMSAPAAQPTAGNPLAVTTYTYNQYGEALTTTAAYGSTGSRTVTNGYDNAGRKTSVAYSTTPTSLGGGSIPTVSFGYSSTFGLPTTISTGTGSSLAVTTTAYNNIAQVTSYNDSTGNSSTMAYDLDGRLTSLYDGKASTTYTYDSATEHRGMITAEDIGVSGALSSFSATYDAAGNLSHETYPNGLVASMNYDQVGNITQLAYAMGSTAWATFNAQYDTNDKIVAQASGASSQALTYDQDGRLTTVQDTASAACTTRQYGLDPDSNRTSFKSYPAGAGGSCSTTTTPLSSAPTYDQADRATSTGYIYDALGRTITVPASDAVGVGSYASATGNLSVSYYANDMVASETQGSTSLSFGLDPQDDRVSTQSDGTSTLTNHYSNASDSPTWTSLGSSAWTRNMLGPNGILAATENQSGSVTLQIADLQGNIVATAADLTTITGFANYGESTEFGIARNATTSPAPYGWLGGGQRSSSALGGTVLMGVRLYNMNTGRFLTVDSINGGNANAYVYPADPINNSDISGMQTPPPDHGTPGSFTIYGEPTECGGDGCFELDLLCDVAAPSGCSVALKWFIVGSARRMLGVSMSFSVQINGHTEIPMHNYGHVESGTYNWHSTWGAPLPGVHARGFYWAPRSFGGRAASYLQRGHGTVRIDMDATGTLGGRLVVGFGYGYWRV